MHRGQPTRLRGVLLPGIGYGCAGATALAGGARGDRARQSERDRGEREKRHSGARGERLDTVVSDKSVSCSRGR